MKNTGKVYLVGAGPGDPGLLTLKGLECLKSAQVVIYDRLVNPKLLTLISPLAQAIYAGKSPRRHTLSQEAINALLVKKAKAGNIVVRLKCGDPFLFGRGAEEAITLARCHIPFEVVPGVSSAFAVPSYAGIPLTHRDYTSSVGIFTGQEDTAKHRSAIDWEKVSCSLGTLVFLMGVENLSEIVGKLTRYGRPPQTPCCVIQQGSLPEQKTVCADLGTIVDKVIKEKITPPAICVVGEVVSLRKEINWFESRPLFGKRVLITRPSLNQEHAFSGLLEAYGASCTEFPVVKIKPLVSYVRLDRVIKQIDRFEWIIFTSQNGVRFFNTRLAFQKKDWRILRGIKLAAIGPKTAAAIKTLGIRVECEARAFCQEGLLDRFRKIKIKGKHIALVRAAEARDILPQGLKKMGAALTIAPAYRTVTKSSPQAASGFLSDFDIISFTSSSCVRGFFNIFSKKAIKSHKNKFKVASIGPITSETARGFRLRVDIEAKEYTFGGLARAIAHYYKK